MSDRLTEKCVRDLRYIASVRNRLAHGEELDPGFDMVYFDASCAAARRELESLSRGSSEPVCGKIAEVDAEFKDEVRSTLRMLARIPLFDAAYFAALAVYGLRRAAPYLIALAFFIIGAATSVNGALDGNRLLAGIGAGFLAIYWGQTAYLAWKHRAMCPELPRWLGMVPVLSAGYLGIAVVKATDKAGFFGGALPLAAQLFAVDFAHDGRWLPALALLAGAWLWGLGLLTARRNAAF